MAKSRSATAYGSAPLEWSEESVAGPLREVTPEDRDPRWAQLVHTFQEQAVTVGSQTPVAEVPTPWSGREAASRRWLNEAPREGRPTATAVITSFNKREDVRNNLLAIRGQSVRFDEVVVVDNHSSDGTQDMIRAEFPEVTLIEMPHSAYGACETFNIGFRNATTEYIAILDDDVELSENWLDLMFEKMASEPPTTAMISSKVIEPEMPDWYLNHPEVNRERYMATFRGCATLARRDVLEQCGYYDEDFFIYGNERDLSARVMNADYRILQYPSATVKHGTPFGMKKGGRSLYYHVRNLWWYLFKNVAWAQILRFFAIQLQLKVRLKKEEIRADAIGTIGIYQVIRETPHGWWIVVKATLAAFLGLPRCLRVRKVCKAPDFSLPTK